MNTHVSILLNPSGLDKRLREVVAMSTPYVILSTSSCGSNFSNLHTVVNSLLPTMTSRRNMSRREYLQQKFRAAALGNWEQLFICIWRFFHVWSDEICNNEKPHIKLLEDMLCLLCTALAGWLLHSASKASTIVANKMPLYVIGHGILAGKYLAEYRDSLK
jgi:hypothetical protein